MSSYHHKYSYEHNNDNANHCYRDVYLTDKKVERLQQMMKRKYFERFERAVIQNYKPKIRTNTSSDIVTLPPTNKLRDKTKSVYILR